MEHKATSRSYAIALHSQNLSYRAISDKIYEDLKIKLGKSSI